MKAGEYLYGSDRVTLDLTGWHTDDPELESSLNRAFPYPPEESTGFEGYDPFPLATVGRRAALALNLQVVNHPEPDPPPPQDKGVVA